MGKAIGFTCDYCGSFNTVTSREQTRPDGWHGVNPSGSSEAKDFCSDHCLAMFGIERYELEGKRFQRKQAGNQTGRPHKKLTDDDVREIKRLAREEDATTTELAEKFGVHSTHILRILKGEARERVT